MTERERERVPREEGEERAEHLHLRARAREQGRLMVVFLTERTENIGAKRGGDGARRRETARDSIFAWRVLRSEIAGGNGSRAEAEFTAR